MKKLNLSVVWAILAAALYAVSTPVSKLLLENVPPTMMAAVLYLGAGMGMLLLGGVRRGIGHGGMGRKLARRDLPYAVGMVVLDIAAPVCLMIGLSTATPANVSLLNNFEIVATSLIALFLFGEMISRRLWLAIGLITLSSMLLIKGFGSGLGSLAIAVAIGEQLPELRYILMALLLGFVAYGLSIFFYVYAQRKLGAAKTSTYYAVAPFIGAALSLAIFRERPGPAFWAALAIMILGTYFASTEGKKAARR